MNANEAAEIISAAIGQDRPLDASDLATALSALGLLTYATEEIAAAARIVSGNPLPPVATSNTQESSCLNTPYPTDGLHRLGGAQMTANEILRQEDLAKGRITATEHHWASHRTRD